MNPIKRKKKSFDPSAPADPNMSILDIIEQPHIVADYQRSFGANSITNYHIRQARLRGMFNA